MNGPSTAPVVARAERARCWLGRIGRLLPVLALVVVAGIVVQHGRGLDPQVLSAPALPLVAAASMLLAYRMLNAGVWTLVLGAVGSRVSPLVATRTWLIAESLRWIPGGIWGYTSRAALGARHGLRPRAVVASLPLELGLTIVAWSAVALVGILASGGLARWGSGLSGLSAQRLVLFVLVGVALIALPWLLLAGARARLSRFLSEFARSCSLVRPSRACAALLGYLVLCACHGCAAYAALTAIEPAGIPFPAVVAVDALAWLLGFFAVFAPSGLGVREASATMLLALWMPADRALLVAIVWRLVDVAVELLVLVLALLWPRVAAPIRPHLVSS